MSLTQEEREVILTLHSEKAQSFLKQGDFLVENHMWDAAANRYYYAMFHLLQMLFLKNELSSHTHRGLLSIFHLNFVKTGKVTPEMGAFVARMEQLRERADYNCAYDVSEAEIMDMQPIVHTFFDCISQLME